MACLNNKYLFFGNQNFIPKKFRLSSDFTHEIEFLNLQKIPIVVCLGI